MTNPWNNKGMTCYPENHINRNSVGFQKKKSTNWIENLSKFIRKIFKKSKHPVIKTLETLRNET